MALSLTQLLYADDLSISSGSVTTASITPANNSLLVVGGMFAPSSVNPTSYTISGGSLAWTRRVSTYDNSQGGFEGAVGIWTAPVTTGASMTVTVAGVTGGNRASFEIACLTGYNTSTPVGATGSATLLGSGAISLSLTGTTASSSYIFGITGGVPNNFGGTAPTQGTGWTRAGWTSDPNPGWLYGSAEYNTGIAVNTVPWQVAMGGGIGFYTEASAAIEVLAAASSSHSLLPCRKPLRFFPRRF